MKRCWVCRGIASSIALAFCVGAAFIVREVVDYRPARPPINWRWMHLDHQGPQLAIWHDGMLGWIYAGISADQALIGYSVDAWPGDPNFFRVTIETRNLSPGEQRR